MKVQILKTFLDAENKCIQKEGKEIEITEERAEQIISIRPDLIEVIGNAEGDTPEFPKHTGGGYYELSNGEKIKGKDAVLKAEEALKSKE
ncbi:MULTISPECIES: hypothetical protein [unclassified Sedimentibacter]|uniref:hypothetical protein n=1 Tax=unclassified Sedimentibacter TaxID=2649220 RepID=UPI0027DF236B|nr:hypothetical protein [Sedimentibacter sp. MB35-C1]WMJ78477.1 hypothetical protein RBQ61_06025 [Sedimentibacter sp. MB35-C1]